MAATQKKWWKEYLGSLSVAYIFAAFFSFFTPLPLMLRIATALMSGFVFGTLFFAVGFAMPRARFRSFWLTCIARSVIVCAVMLVGMMFVLPIGIGMSAKPPIPPWNANVWLVFSKIAPALLGTWIPVGLLMSFSVNALYQIDRKLGPGVLKNWMTGKYHSPKEEERIFMFLDLKNSTTLAEKLGNIRFSKLCQDFFRDLTGPITETQGEVSHYIGDEAVLTWKPKNGLGKGNCIRCFYLMRDAIAEHATKYRQDYGIVPEFKAGVHVGLVVAAEVGEIKSEIVYHGDVLNTTARITGMCSEFNSDLLISGDLWSRIEAPAGVQAQPLGLHLLKGKEHAVEIVAIYVEEDPPLNLSAIEDRSEILLLSDKSSQAPGG